MNALRGYVITAVVALLVGAGGGLGFGWRYWRPQSVVETPAPSVRQKDSSLILARVPDAKAKPKQQIPAGATVERIDHIVVQPRAVPVPASSDSGRNENPAHDSASSNRIVDNVSRGTFLCPPVRIDLTLIRLKDNTQRVIASSPDGTVIDSLSVDTPVEKATVQRKLAWSAGPIWGGGDNGIGVNATRDLGPLRLVAAVMRAPPRGPLSARPVGMLAVNIRF